MIEPAQPGSPATGVIRATPNRSPRRGWARPGTECTLGLAPPQRRPAPSLACRLHWWSQLPPQWRGDVVQAQTYRISTEHEVPARRVLGHDADGAPCFCAYDYRRLELRSDDDEDLYQALAYGESVRAWRLRDGRWLVHRHLEPFGEDGDCEQGLRLAERMPR